MVFVTTGKKSARPSRLRPLIFIAALILPAVNSIANPVPADDLSIANGFEAYDLHCATCHGTKSMPEDEQWYEPDTFKDDIDYDALIDKAQAKRQASQKEKFANVSGRDGAGRWAELPDPGGKANDASVRAQIMADLVAEIEREYGTQVAEQELEEYSTEYDLAEELGFNDLGEDDAMPGAPDLADPESFIYGTDEYDLYNTIAKGVGSATLMPGFLSELGSEEAVWDLVNFIRSQWAEEWLD
ncbi:MAG: cytochrome c [Halioglobus sp.]